MTVIYYSVYLLAVRLFAHTSSFRRGFVFIPDLDLESNDYPWAGFSWADVACCGEEEATFRSTFKFSHSVAWRMQKKLS